MAARISAVRRTRSRINPRSRHIKITGSYYEYQLRGRGCPPPPPVPEIRLKGYWIALAGFEVGESVRVRVSRRRITIVPVD